MIGAVLLFAGFGASYGKLHRYIANDYEIVEECGILESSGTNDRGKLTNDYFVLLNDDSSRKYRYSDAGVRRLIESERKEQSSICISRYKNSYSLKGMVVILKMSIDNNEVYRFKKGKGFYFSNILMAIGFFILISQYVFNKRGVRNGEK